MCRVQVSRERVWTEFRRILSGPRATMVLDRMAQDRVLESILDPSIVPGSRGLRALSKLRCVLNCGLRLWGSAITMESCVQVNFGPLKASSAVEAEVCAELCSHTLGVLRSLLNCVLTRWGCLDHC